ncbi:ClpXP protease specificity-enhancing factor [Variovorax saccharolyticus]|uniref:ClpXP protease specificity-enhancing factor n=1 Tax=Variovorax saccharolyticus TaxID=3053516 RepID=UPI002574DD82|nr:MULTISPECIES: ClpXP protease specificity-enhancing factor [unclassified Variovorax]MDM0017985.1 ClpXP protease specificity-enhancing factor [Variovorax sp. J22R187]MDM0024956.1 ClpXP protease specificity-enhancing factor [Variovorax sp. J31P216]
MINALESSSTRPYLIRALYEWCTDNGFTPYVAVQVDDTVQVPREYVKNGEIVLNISFDATSSLKLGNDFIEFKARFAGTAREISVPVGRVIAIYARENGQGMAFPAPAPAAGEGSSPAASTSTAASTRTPLRDASRGTEGDASKVVHLVSEADETAETGSAPLEPEDPPRPPAGGGARPSLKRIK